MSDSKILGKIAILVGALAGQGDPLKPFTIDNSPWSDGPVV